MQAENGLESMSLLSFSSSLLLLGLILGSQYTVIDHQLAKTGSCKGVPTAVVKLIELRKEQQTHADGEAKTNVDGNGGRLDRIANEKKKGLSKTKQKYEATAQADAADIKRGSVAKPGAPATQTPHRRRRPRPTPTAAQLLAQQVCPPPCSKRQFLYECLYTCFFVKMRIHITTGLLTST